MPMHASRPKPQSFNDAKSPLEIAEKRTGNLFDYVNWRGDIPMSVDPFNEVDNLLLSALAYVPFDGLVSGEGMEGSISVNDLNQAFWEKHGNDSFETMNPAIGFSPYLLKKIAGSRRFGGMRACSYTNEFDDDEQYQFAAVTFLLEDGTCYAAFRGTDDSIAGWREDFNMSYMAMTRGQERAVEYLDRRFSGSSPFVRVGGHSKGGNLAVYAGMYCLPEIQERIKEIWSNDGPGFIKTITESDDYMRILPKIKKLVPEESIVGILLNSGAKADVVQSTEEGLLQHSPYSWKIRRNSLIRARKRSAGSVFIDRTMDAWLLELDADARKVFIDVLFNSIQASGAKTISDFTEDPINAYNAIYKSIKDLPLKQRATLLFVLQKLAVSGTNQIVSGLVEKLSSLAQKLHD